MRRDCLKPDILRLEKQRNKELLVQAQGNRLFEIGASRTVGLVFDAPIPPIYNDFN